MSNGTKLDAIHVWDRYLTDEKPTWFLHSYAGWEYTTVRATLPVAALLLVAPTRNARNYTLKAFTSRLVGFPVLILCEHENAKFYDEDNHELPSEARDDDLYAVQVTLDTEAQTIQARF